ncbi:MAG: DUF2442 domain-containing protein [Bacteroidales bacterium]|nr:DUF2442 domain-containing protein [Bacteroidales bacterium]
MIQTLDYATYRSEDYWIDVLFDSGELKAVSMKDFIFQSNNPLISQYKDTVIFKRDFSYDKFGVYWGNDMSVSSDWLYNQPNAIQ